MLKSTLAICGALATGAWMNPVMAQQNPPPQNLPAATNQTQNIKRITLQRFDVPEGAYEAVIGIAEIAPNVSIGRHTHPGPESGYLLEGSLELLIDGEPPRQVKTGESYKVPARAIHDAKTGLEGAKVIATYVVERGQPLASVAK